MSPVHEAYPETQANNPEIGNKQWMGYNATDDFCFSGVNTLCGAFRNASPKVYHAAVLRNDTLCSFSAHILKFASSQKQRDRRRAKRPDP